MNEEAKQGEPKLDNARFEVMSDMATDALKEFLDGVEKTVAEATGNRGMAQIVSIRALEEALTIRIAMTIKAESRMECIDRLVSLMRQKMARFAQYEAALNAGPSSQKPN